MEVLKGMDFLEEVQKSMKTLNKFRYQAVITMKKRNMDQPQITSSTCDHIFCEIDRTAKVAYLKITEGYQYANNVMEMYYVNNQQYVRSSDTWIKNTIKKEDLDRIFEHNQLLLDLNLLKNQSVSINQAANNPNRMTVVIPITDTQVKSTVSSLVKGAQLKQKLADTQLEIDVDLPSYLIEGMNIQAEGDISENGQNIHYTETSKVNLSPLAPDYNIALPASLIAVHHQPEMLNLAAAATAAKCWCTGCAACAACVTCAACISCIACIFPPALAPVTAAAAGTAIAVATSVATGASVSIATANQGN